MVVVVVVVVVVGVVVVASLLQPEALEVAANFEAWMDSHDDALEEALGAERLTRLRASPTSPRPKVGFAPHRERQLHSSSSGNVKKGRKRRKLWRRRRRRRRRRRESPRRRQRKEQKKKRRRRKRRLRASESAHHFSFPFRSSVGADRRELCERLFPEKKAGKTKTGGKKQKKEGRRSYTCSSGGAIDFRRMRGALE